ncbi:MAG: ATP synthase F0 subunit C [Firmicutes bacterium]|nr:ATP synthase F0 subunit C [Candidatus Alectryobacillus merdavium]
MEYITMALFAIAISIVGIGEAIGTFKALDGIARNPEAGDKIRTTLIIGTALVETCAIYILVLGILVWFVR